MTWLSVGGKRIDLDTGTNTFYPPGDSFESAETEVVKKTVKGGDVCLDLGANIGWYTVLMSELVGAKGHVFAFEPHPANFQVLVRNTAGRENVTAIMAAVGDEDGKVPLYESVTGNSGDHRLDLSSGDVADTGLRVDVRRLDTLFLGKSRVDFVKADIQGSEGRMLRGMKGIIKANPRLVMLLEVSDLLDLNGVGQQSFVQELRAEGFALDIVSSTPGRLVNYLARLPGP